MTPLKVRPRSRRFLRIVSILAFAGGIPLLQMGLAAGATVDPVYKAGNPSCADIDSSWTELKIEPVSDQTKSDGTLTVTIDVTGNTFDWTSNIGVDAVIVKGGPNANLYRYDPPAEVKSDKGLHAPFNDSSGDWYGLSHISFCYDVEQPPPSPTPTVTVTPTETPTESASVLPTVVSSSPSVLGEQIAKTGSNRALNGPLTFIGAAMILIGMSLFGFSTVKLKRLEP